LEVLKKQVSTELKVSAKRKPDNIFGIMPVSRAEQYDTYEIIKCIVDNSEYEEYKPDYGKVLFVLLQELTVGL
jgi:acetyl-CoA carboxylase carboxyltransferase component